MTSIDIPVEQLPSHVKYLTTVCPSDGILDCNVHYKLPENKVKDYNVDWPVEGQQRKGRIYLDDTYLNVARPPLNDIRNESTTYVSLPYHVMNIFDRVVNEKLKSKDGIMHIGANVNALRQDPFKMVHLNPGCLTSFIEVDSLERGNTGTNQNSSKSAFNNFTTNFNKFLKISSFGEKSNGLPFSGFSNIIENRSVTSSSNIFDKILDFNSDIYFSEIKYCETSKILVSVNVNVLNIFSFGSDLQYKGTKDIVTEKSFIPFNEENKESYKKVIEVPIFRLQFRQNVFATSLKTFVSLNDHAMVVIGFDSGEVLVIDLNLLKYRIFDDLSTHNNYSSEASPVAPTNHSSSFNNAAVTSLEVMRHWKYECLILAGHANGEVSIYNPFAEVDHEKSKSKYYKKIVASDAYITFFKTFNLSPFEDDSRDHRDEKVNPHIVGHFKLSNKPITSIKSTYPYNITPSSQSSPSIIAIASDDGFVRFIDLSMTHPQIHSKSIITDIISNYFNDGIIDVEFSHDHKFVCVVGKGDLIEVFKMTYYNMNGLLQKGHNFTHASNTNINSMNNRSRSNTLNSVNSTTQNNTFLSPSRHSSEYHENGISESYPSVIKDIRMISRFKGHANTVNKVRFLSNNLTTTYCTRSNSLVYKLASCGFDGKVIIWELDYKALPKVKCPHVHKIKKPQASSQPKKHNSLVQATSPSPVGNRKHPTNNGISMMNNSHGRNKSLTNEDTHNISVTMNSTFSQFNSTLDSTNSMINMASLLNPVSRNSDAVHGTETNLEQRKIVLSLYQSLYDLRIKRISNEMNNLMSSVIHPIIEDKFVPSINTPATQVDLSPLIRDGKLDGFHVDSDVFWCFAKNGDLFRFFIDHLS